MQSTFGAERRCYRTIGALPFDTRATGTTSSLSPHAGRTRGEVSAGWRCAHFCVCLK